MRVALLPKRLLGLSAVSVTDVEVERFAGAERITITVARRTNRRMCCSRCGRRCRAVYDRQIRSWRHLDAFRVRCIVRAEVRRVICPGCGICAESVPWARPGSRSTRMFEDTCVWLARSAPKSVVAHVMLNRLGDGGPDDRAGRGRAHGHTPGRRPRRPGAHRHL